MNKETMSIQQLADFTGKSYDTIRRRVKEAGIETINGKETLLKIDDVKLICEKIYKKLPLAVKIAIDNTFAKHEGLNIANAKVEESLISIKKSDLESIVSTTVAATIKSLVDNNVLPAISAPKKEEEETKLKLVALPAPKEKLEEDLQSINTDLSIRQEIDLNLKKYCRENGRDIASTRSELYQRLSYLQGYNLSIQAKNKNVNKIDYLERFDIDGIKILLKLTRELLNTPKDVKEPVNKKRRKIIQSFDVVTNQAV